MNKIKEFLNDIFSYYIFPVFNVLGIISFIITIIFGVAGFQYKVHEWKCEMKATVQGLEWSYKLGQGCMVKTENGWIDYNKLIYTKGTR